MATVARGAGAQARRIGKAAPGAGRAGGLARRVRKAAARARLTGAQAAGVGEAAPVASLAGAQAARVGEPAAGADRAVALARVDREAAARAQRAGALALRRGVRADRAVGAVGAAARGAGRAQRAVRGVAARGAGAHDARRGVGHGVGEAPLRARLAPPRGVDEAVPADAGGAPRHHGAVPRARVAGRAAGAVGVGGGRARVARPRVRRRRLVAAHQAGQAVAAPRAVASGRADAGGAPQRAVGARQARRLPLARRVGRGRALGAEGGVGRRVRAPGAGRAALVAAVAAGRADAGGAPQRAAPAARARVAGRPARSVRVGGVRARGARRVGRVVLVGAHGARGAVAERAPRPRGAGQRHAVQAPGLYVARPAGRDRGGDLLHLDHLDELGEEAPAGWLQRRGALEERDPPPLPAGLQQLREALVVDEAQADVGRPLVAAARERDLHHGGVELDDERLRQGEGHGLRLQRARGVEGDHPRQVGVDGGVAHPILQAGAGQELVLLGGDAGGRARCARDVVLGRAVCEFVLLDGARGAGGALRRREREAAGRARRRERQDVLLGPYHPAQRRDKARGVQHARQRLVRRERRGQAGERGQNRQGPSHARFRMGVRAYISRSL